MCREQWRAIISAQGAHIEFLHNSGRVGLKRSRFCVNLCKFIQIYLDRRLEYAFELHGLFVLVGA